MTEIKDNSQLELGGAFNLPDIEGKTQVIDLPKAPEPTALPTEQSVLNKDGIDERLLELIPDVRKMWSDQEIEIDFKKGGHGPVGLRKPAFVLFPREIRGKVCWTLVAPTLVKHPKYEEPWIIGSENFPNPDDPTKTKKFTFPLIVAGKNNYVERVTKREDLELLKKLWRGMKFQEENLPKQKALPIPAASLPIKS